MINYAHELNSEQLDVVLHGEGPCLVLAGAGSGKTRTITYRVAYLLEQGVKPEEVLLVTFTNKAAAEMKARVMKLEIGQYENNEIVKVLPWSGTFHHIAYRILRQHAPALGYGNNFTVLDSEDSESLLKLCVKEVKAGDGPVRFPSAGVVQSIISYARNAELHLADVIDKKYGQWMHVGPEIERIAAEYSRRKKEANAMDFDDLLANLLLLLNDDRMRNKFAAHFRYVLVDEYQDTNKIQASIIKKFSSVHKNILVVGDDAQSIYSFRAADIQNILQFEKEYPGAKIFRLETNYRSSEEILEVANEVIAHNRDQYQKHLRALLKGNKPELYPQIDQPSEAALVVKKIKELLGQGVPAEEIAVLFRAAYHSQMLEVELVQAGIDYEYRGGVRFFERAHVKDVLAYLRILNNLADTAAWLRVLMHEEGIGPAAAQKVIEEVRRVIQVSKTSQGKEADDDNRANLVELVGRIGFEVLGSKAQVGWNNFIRTWNLLADTFFKVGTPGELIRAAMHSPYREYLEAEYVDSRDRLADLEQLAAFGERYETLEQFLAETSLQESFRGLSDDRAAEKIGESPKKKIILSTIHQAKGLEWQAVFIINLSAGAFPSDRALREPSGLEEERRLFYVAITRAKKQLYLTYPMAGGAYGDFLAGPSPFLNEIPPGLLEDHSLLSTDTTSLDDPSADIRYVSEDEEYSNRRSPKIKPGSFLRDVDDL